MFSCDMKKRVVFFFFFSVCHRYIKTCLCGEVLESYCYYLIDFVAKLVAQP
jgi:hypothetical protein